MFKYLENIKAFNDKTNITGFISEKQKIQNITDRVYKCRLCLFPSNECWGSDTLSEVSDKTKILHRNSQKEGE